MATRSSYFFTTASIANIRVCSGAVELMGAFFAASIDDCGRDVENPRLPIFVREPLATADF
jgi:hypothetical protein